MWCYDGVVSNSQPNCHSNRFPPNGSWVDFQNESGNDWQRISDSFGDLTHVFEPSPASSTLSLETDYVYNGLSDLTSVTQKGNGTTDTARGRSFTYDSLSELQTSQNPETGTISYSFDAAGNLLSKTDARSVTVSYKYDPLNRMYAKNYSSGDPSVCLQYDKTIAGASDAYPINRLTLEWTWPSASCPAWSSPVSTVPTTAYTSTAIMTHDVMGRVTSEQQCPFGSTCGAEYTLNYSYDLAGDSTGLTNSVGAGLSTPLTLTYSYDAGDHLTNVGSSAAAYPTNLYTLGSSTPPNDGNCSSPQYGYGPAGPLSWMLGPNVTVGQCYTNRLWTHAINATGQVP